MMPGMPRDPRQMQAMMRRLGMSSESLPGVEEVVIRTATHDHVFRSPDVTILTIQGVKTYQIVGAATVRPRTAARSPAGEEAGAPPGPARPEFPPEDVELVATQAGVSAEEALEALRAAHGAPAEAILALLARRGSR